MESSSIVIKVMSCRDLKAFNFFQKKSVYALVSIAREDPNKKKLEHSQQQRTPTDGEGDSNPEWNHEMRFDLDEDSFQDHDHLFIHFHLHAEVPVIGDKTIGEVRVPFKDLIDEFNGVVRFVSYEVRGSDGKPNGVLNFSYKVNAKGKGNEVGAAFPASNIDGYSVVHQPPPEALYPKVEVEVQYPSTTELSNPSQETNLGPEGDHYHSPEVQHTSHEVHHPPPYENYYPPPPPPPPHNIYYPPPPFPLPPPPWAFHHHHPPPPPWAFSSSHDSSGHGPGSPDVGRSATSSNGDTWPRGIRAERELYPYPWNGR